MVIHGTAETPAVSLLATGAVTQNVETYLIEETTKSSRLFERTERRKAARAAAFPASS